MYAASIFLYILFWILSRTEGGLFGHEDPSQNIIGNWDMEDPFSSSDWTTGRGQVTRTQNEANTGNYSAFISSRFGGLYQKLNFGSSNPLLQPQHSYYISSYIKFANNATNGYIRLRCMYRVVFQDGSKNYQTPYARLHYQFADGDWNQSFAPPAGLPTPKYLQIFFEVNPTNINYYMDTFAVTRITELGTNWKSTLSSNVPNNIQLSSTRIEVNMTRPWFNWGPAVGDWHFDGNTRLQQNLKAYMKKYFSWATFTNSMKWLRMEQTKGQISFYPVDNSVQWLVSNNFHVRDHTILWEIKEANPYWLHNIQGQQMVNEMMRRINYTMDFWKDDIYEWDMCNEYLNNHFYEDASGQIDLNLLVDEFKYANSLDSSAKLCINEYRVLRDGQLTSAEANLALKLKNKQAPVNCLAAQSHLRLGDANDYNIDRYLKRLQILSAANLPITISEFTLQVTNITNRAAILEKLLYAIYSEPKVQGVIFWSLSDLPQLSFETDSHFVEGVNFLPNEAGRVLEELLGNEWRSYKSYTPSVKRRYRYIRTLYHGYYKLTMYVNNNVHKVINFTLNPASSRKIVRANF
ncbi:hypothetical protein LSH36_362g02013 [Paralvinella palmiformis]|uniref:GH10 domain-containing protein n=1 Tax=Paralvinella palmiformis TaxID=53620 RepID=A0AAD9JE34_9ANNE|nr:hypothetical protein LSH36_362g02013 [Paralvinella palmiformis]